MVEQKLKKKCTIYFLFTYFHFVEKGGGGSALNICSIFSTHHRIPNEHMMTILIRSQIIMKLIIYVIKTVMKY